MTITIKVPDMSCDHCKMRIQKALMGLDGVKSVEVDLESKHVTIAGDIDKEKVVSTIEDAGYSVEEV